MGFWSNLRSRLAANQPAEVTPPAPTEAQKRATTKRELKALNAAKTAEKPFAKVKTVEKKAVVKTVPKTAAKKPAVKAKTTTTKTVKKVAAPKKTAKASK
jgi:hypothetical protein